MMSQRVDLTFEELGAILELIYKDEAGKIHDIGDVVGKIEYAYCEAMTWVPND